MEARDQNWEIKEWGNNPPLLKNMKKQGKIGNVKTQKQKQEQLDTLYVSNACLL